VHLLYFSNWLAETYLEGESGLRNRGLIVFSFPSTLSFAPSASFAVMD
jgi:hypothetical protein